MLNNAQHNHDIDQAAQRLLEGGLVAFPTETVYGLGADAENPDAIAKIYAAKQRPANHPLIVHLAPGADVLYWTGKMPAMAQALMDAFWPGPLTLILPRATHIPAAVSGGQSTIGLRCPSHPTAQALLTRFAALKPGGHGGVAGPSANQFGSVSPTQAQHVRSEFPELDSSQLLILDGEPSTVGIESTIVDVSGQNEARRPVVLRPGHISTEQIAQVLGVMPGRPHGASPQVSGTLKAHYAPRTPLWLVQTDDLPEAIRISARQADSRVAALVFHVPAKMDTATISGTVDYVTGDRDAQVYARKLYGLLRSLDQKGYTTLIVEQPPDALAWHAVNDRLGRAAAAFSERLFR